MGTSVDQSLTLFNAHQTLVCLFAIHAAEETYIDLFILEETAVDLGGLDAATRPNLFNLAAHRDIGFLVLLVVMMILLQ